MTQLIHKWVSLRIETSISRPISYYQYLPPTPTETHFADHSRDFYPVN
jgi:hypothetical protein